LEGAGLLSRSPDPTDSRVKRLKCTAEGRKVSRASIARIEAVDDMFFGPDGERASSVESLRRLAGRDERGDIVDERWNRG
jgi:DNA-binding MarR family transcriptional regulator